MRIRPTLSCGRPTETRRSGRCSKATVPTTEAGQKQQVAVNAAAKLLIDTDKTYRPMVRRNALEIAVAPVRSWQPRKPEVVQEIDLD